MVAPSVNAPQDEDFTGYTATQSQVSTPSFSPPRVCSVVFSAVKLASKKKQKLKTAKFETAESSLLYASRECDRKSHTPLYSTPPSYFMLRVPLARLVVNLAAFVKGGSDHEMRKFPLDHSLLCVGVMGLHHET